MRDAYAFFDRVLLFELPELDVFIRASGNEAFPVRTDVHRLNGSCVCLDRVD